MPTSSLPCLRWTSYRALHAAATLTFAYLCAGELLPLPARKAWLPRSAYHEWAQQQVVLLMALSVLAVLLMGCSGGGGGGCSPVREDRASAAQLLAALNVLPLVAAVGVTPWVTLSDNCPVAPGIDCDYLGTVLDVVGLCTARISRLDLGICVLLAARCDSWLLGATDGKLGYAEAIPLHRTAGWWCAGQSALHSIAYLLFYLETGGFNSVWLYCFPAPLPSGKLNRLGLVNFLGLVACVALLVLVLPARPQFRHRCYHVFQRLHLPAAALFILCCALHDLPILLFAVPGLAAWSLDRRGNGSSAPLGCRRRLLPAKATLLPGTSGPWVEITVDCGAAPGACSSAAPRGQWVSLRVAPLGTEWHPLSVTTPADGSEAALCVVVSVRAGDWSRALADLCSKPATASFDVELDGPFAFGGGSWSLSGEGGCQPPLLLLAGGTGVTGWLPALAAAAASSSSSSSGRPCHLVWCVQDRADYLALAKRLPPVGGGVRVTVYVTRAATSGAGGPLAIDAPVGERAWAATRPRPRRCSTSAAASLAAALVGLVVGFWGWSYVVDAMSLPRVAPDDGWLHQTLSGYTISRRCLPIVLIVASMVIATATCRWVCACAPSKRCHPTDTELCAASPQQQPQQALFTGVSSSAPGAWAAQAPPPRQGSTGDGAAAADSAGGHEVRSGRPDVDALVRAATAGLKTCHLVVAACGPPALVETARKAVVAARKERHSHGVLIEFSGSDSRW
tara:strand:- start:346 stop:2553 length:2208 start_codon:yes stop_codon:yes gene_type:complete